MTELSRCPYCGGKLVRTSEDTLVCEQCGRVFTIREYDLSPTRDDDYITFIPTSPDVPNVGLPIIADPSGRGFKYRYNSIERNMKNALGVISNIVEAIDLPRGVKRTAAAIYRTALEKKLAKGRSVNAMVGAAIYAACRIHRIPRTLDEIARAANVSRKELGRCYRLLLRNIEGLNVPPARPEDYVVRFAALLGMSNDAISIAKDIIRRAKEMGLTTGKDPTGLAAAALYIAGIITGERRTQRAIAEVATVTEVTVRNRYKELVRKLGIELETRFFMRFPHLAAVALAVLPPLLTFVRASELIGAEYALRLATLSAPAFLVAAQRVYDTLNTHEAELIFSIYTRTYERSIRFVPVISFLTIVAVAFYALSPLIAPILLPFVARYSARSAYALSAPFFGDPKKAASELAKSLAALIIFAAAPALLASGPSIRGIVERYRPIYLQARSLAAYSPRLLHDAFLEFSPVATGLAALIAIFSRTRFRPIPLVALFSAILAYAIVEGIELLITAFVFITALYERSSMNINKSLMVPNIGALSRIVPLGFTIVMTFVGGTIEKYLGTSLIPAGFISILTFVSLSLGLVLLRYLLKLPSISGMKLGVIRI